MGHLPADPVVKTLPSNEVGMGREEGGGFRMGSTCIPEIKKNNKKKK